jgi:hypothetical protein
LVRGACTGFLSDLFLPDTNHSITPRPRSDRAGAQAAEGEPRAGRRRTELTTAVAIELAPKRQKAASGSTMASSPAVTVLTLCSLALVPPSAPGVRADVGRWVRPGEQTGSATQSAGCASSLDCSLNGECDVATGRCNCDVGWKGPGCASLDLAPQTTDTMLNETNLSTWGAPAVFAEGAYHAYVSEMVEACGITSWQSNSQLTHYVAETPNGPWQRKDVAVPLWSHCATVAVVPNNTGTTLLMTHMSRGAKGRKCLPSGCCVGGASPCGMKHPCNASRTFLGPDSARAGESAPHTDGNLPIKYAHSPDGPWLQTSVQVRNLSRFFLAAPLVLPNGTAFMVVETPPLSTLLRAETWRGPYDVVTRAACGGGEGASIWADRAGRGLHCMYHRAPFNVSSRDGGHSFSTDGVNWFCARKGDGLHTSCHAAENGDAESIPMYGSTIDFEGGGRISYGTRERPHAITDAGGSLVAVSSSLQLCAPLAPAGGSGSWSSPGPYSQCTNRWPGYSDRTWTSILPVNADDNSIGTNQLSSRASTGTVPPSQVIDL